MSSGSEASIDGRRPGLLGRLTGRGQTAADRDSAELFINADDITEIWRRFPGLDPAGRAASQLPPGLLTAGQDHLLALAPLLRSAASRLVNELRPAVGALAARWSAANSQAGTWPQVGEVLVAGLGLGLAVPRAVPGREASVFALLGGTNGLHRPVSSRRAPFLRLIFLPGSGEAGLALLRSDGWPAWSRIAEAAESAEFAQTLASYERERREVVAYGRAGNELVAAGILRREGRFGQTSVKLAVAAVGLEALRAVEAEWHAVVTDAARSLAAARPEVDAACSAVLGASAGTPGDAISAASGDSRDLAHFVLADLAHDGLSAAGLFGEGGSRRPLPRAILIERPQAVWQWLCATAGREPERP